MARFLEIDAGEAFLSAIAHAVSFDTMKQKADRLVPDHEVTFNSGARVFVNKGTIGRWRGVLDEDDLKLYEAAVARKLSAACARWLENGRLANP